MFKTMYKEFGTIDILVNNAGLQRDAPFHEMTIDQWNKVISVNLTGSFFVPGKPSSKCCGVARYPKDQQPVVRSFV
jgi:hypothetical protein